MGDTAAADSAATEAAAVLARPAGPEPAV